MIKKKYWAIKIPVKMSKSLILLASNLLLFSSWNHTRGTSVPPLPINLCRRYLSHVDVVRRYLLYVYFYAVQPLFKYYILLHRTFQCLHRVPIYTCICTLHKADGTFFSKSYYLNSKFFRKTTCKIPFSKEDTFCNFIKNRTPYNYSNQY